MTSTLTLLEESFTEISYDQKNKILKAKWKGFLKVDEVRKGCSEMTKFIELHKVTKHMSDHSELRVLSREVQEYLTKEWFPEVLNVGLRKVAVVLSEDVFAQATVNNVNMISQRDQLLFNSFDNHTQAIQWLNADS